MLRIQLVLVANFSGIIFELTFSRAARLDETLRVLDKIAKTDKLMYRDFFRHNSAFSHSMMRVKVVVAAAAATVAAAVVVVREIWILHLLLLVSLHFGCFLSSNLLKKKNPSNK